MIYINSIIIENNYEVKGEMLVFQQGTSGVYKGIETRKQGG